MSQGKERFQKSRENKKEGFYVIGLLLLVGSGLAAWMYGSMGEWGNAVIAGIVFLVVLYARVLEVEDCRARNARDRWWSELDRW